ncbi:MAG TPA: hypothetical protein VM143_11840 [Acidimicrobiales bacterium]|nr:hypothetical protein [Acidimicrobiales bacterium]
MPHRKFLAVAVAVATATSACRVDVSVGIDSNADGGGEVRAQARLDGGAVNQLGGPDPAERIRLDDLRAAGWDVEGPTRQDDGALQIVATHGYATEREAEALVADLGGDPGPLRDFAVHQHRTFLRTTTDFTGTVDLEAGLGAFTDPDLQEALGSTADAPLGVTSAALEKRLGAALDRLFGMQVAVRLPGEVTSNAPTEADNGAVWAPSLGEEVRLEAHSERWNVRNIAGAAVAAASALALTSLLALRRRRPDNVTVGNDGETGTDRGGAPGPEG